MHHIVRQDGVSMAVGIESTFPLPDCFVVGRAEALPTERAPTVRMQMDVGNVEQHRCGGPARSNGRPAVVDFVFRHRGPRAGRT